MLDRRSFAATIGAIAVFTPRRTFAAVNQSKLARAVDLGSRNGGSGAIYYDGGRIAAWGDQNHKYSLKSSTKSFGSILLGLAIKENRVSINGKGQTYLAGFGTPPTSNKATGWPGGITLRHCATHTAGFDKKGNFQPLLFKYGTKWSYSDCGANWLADVLTVRFGQDLYAVLRNKILVPIGASSGVTWRVNAYRRTR